MKVVNAAQQKFVSSELVRLVRKLSKNGMSGI